MKKKIILTILLILALIQFIRIDKTNPQSNPDIDFITQTNPPGELGSLFKKACYDCHSHYTRYPWYTNVAPLSFWIKGHIKGARQNLNFSTWGDSPAEDQNHLLKECIEELEERNMPLKSYTWLHSESKLSDEDISAMVEWLNTYRKSVN